MRVKTMFLNGVVGSIAMTSLVLGWSFLVPGQRTLHGDEKNPAKTSTYHSPLALAVSPDGKTIYASDRTARSIAILDTTTRIKRSEIALQGQPRGIALSADGATLYAAEYGQGSIAVVNTAKAAVVGRIPVGRNPVNVAFAPKGSRLYVCNQDSHGVSVVDLCQDPPKTIKQVVVAREPSAAAVTPDEKYVVVANQLPHGRSTDPSLGAVVSIIDATKLEPTAAVKLPPGSTVVNGVCVSPDGKWAYVVHGLGHFNLPMTQLERGWVNTYALSIIDIAKGARLATLLLDDLTQGASDPHTVVCSKDGARLWISHSGVHEISIIEIALVHDLLNGKVSEQLAQLRDGSLPNIWVRIQKDRALIEELANDLTALYIAGAIRRVPSGGNGPRGVVLAPDGNLLYVANYYAGAVAVLKSADGKAQGSISLGSEPKPDAVRRGEVLFHDATKSFQRWHSCASCHPNDGRVDGLRWDFVDDGLGNAMNTLPLLHPDKMPPLHRLGTLSDVKVAAKHGLTFTHMLVPTDQEVEDLIAYLSSLRPEPSPHLAADGKPTEAALRGKVIFEGKADCARCHSGPHFTDCKMYAVGVISETEPEAKYKTTALHELHRTAPYLHDGRALTLKEVLTTYNPKDLHGKTRELTEREIEDLVAYLLSL